MKLKRETEEMDNTVQSESCNYVSEVQGGQKLKV
jgi:hypothetical protein